MKVLILAGGLGSRLSEETTVKPKPMVEINNVPMIIYIMKHYASFGFKDFVILGGYKIDFIKNYFSSLKTNLNDFTIDLKDNQIQFYKNNIDWNVTILDTGLNSLTGTRIRAVKKIVEEDFLLTYGDGIGNIDIKKSISFHKKNKAIVTFTKVHPPNQFGKFKEDKSGKVLSFQEKILQKNDWINGGFYVCNKKLFNFMPKKINFSLEDTVLPKIAKNGKLFAYPHHSFWKCVDTLKDKIDLERLMNEEKLQ